MISVFGARAEAFARGLSGIEAAVITNSELTSSAYVAAVTRRETGLPFYGMVLYEDLRSRMIMLNVATLAEGIADFDLRRGLVEGFCSGVLPLTAGGVSADLWAKPEPLVQQVIGEFFSLCDAMLVRSNTEYLRLVPLLKRARQFEIAVVEPVLPHFERTQPAGPSVVVWAPYHTSRQVAVQAVALTEFLGEITFVTGDGEPLGGYPGRFMRAGDDVAEVLARACCVLCADPDDPGAAIAFARRGVGVVAPLSAGAHEFVRGLVTYDIGTLRSITEAVQIALAQPASVRAVPQAPRAPERPALPAVQPLPLVSVVLCTYNRREDVTRALTCLQQQTYPNIEVVVVNDAGENVDDVIARFPQARPHNIPVNGGVLKAIGEGLRQARGDYVQVLADDDWLEPDHVEALVGAMLRTGAWIAHTNTLIRHQELVPGSEPKTVGFNAIVFSESTTPTDALIATPIAGHSIIFRRDMLEAIGTWREDCILADQEFQLRAAGKYVLVYVDRITAEWRSRGSDNLSTVTDSTVEMRRMYEELHPISGRPHLQRRREEALGRVGTRTVGVFAFPPTLEVGSQ